MDSYIGKLLDNRYEILELVGVGGMAKVYKARCHRLNRLVAIKILREDLAQDTEFRRRFHDEAQAVAMLSHPNIVAVYDVSRSSELEYIVMELIDGITLKQYMQKKGNKLNWREALHFITQITKALGHAHSRGIIHRDIKPHNVMVLRDGSVKVADFGIARVVSGGHSTLTQEALGSVHYISPEQARGSHIDARSDLYSAGVVLYEMITGRLPFEGDTPVSVAIQHINSIPLSPREIDPTIPEALEAITMKAMAPNPDDRYPSADAMLADLEEFRKNPSINFDYHVNEFVPEEELDVDRTQIHTVPTHSRERIRESDSYVERRSQRSHRRVEEEPDEPQGRGPIWPVAAAVAAVLLFLVGVVYFLYRVLFSDLFAPAETFEVPKLTGETYASVQDDRDLLGTFTVTLGDTVPDDAEEGTIINQKPAAGSKVTDPKTEIVVTVSGGSDTVTMIDLYDMDYREAFDALQELGLSYDTPDYDYDDTVAADHVISFTPLKDTQVSKNATVHMVISKGPKSKTLTMPSLLDRTEAQAKSDITMMNLAVGSVDKVYSDTVEAGKVAGQYPTATTQVEEGTKVNLQISMGPDPSSKTDKQITKTVDIPLPDTGDTVELTVTMDGKTILQHSYDTAMEMSASVQVTGTEGTTKMLTYYWNGTQSGTCEVNFSE